ncbi:hypothetical protein E2C01_037328 [Portunus trituberculatus]|uniref:Uncharacterized protein n=1 Tax=Portunus trituberculatus TaxID=210409 RepID=A0A5B7FED1_PORTR|nr:hypothetical protein [Portunus trituberculatus]
MLLEIHSACELPRAPSPRRSPTPGLQIHHAASWSLPGGQQREVTPARHGEPGALMCGLAMCGALRLTPPLAHAPSEHHLDGSLGGHRARTPPCLLTVFPLSVSSFLRRMPWFSRLD